MKNYYRNRKDPKTYEEFEAEYRAGLPREMRKAGTQPKTLKQIRKQVRKVAAEDERKIRAGAKVLGSAGVLTGRRAKRTVKGDITKKMKKGGSTVNKAGNYTKPTMRKALFNRIKAGGKGGRPGQWSARKAQMLAKQYKAKGGGYRG